MFQQAKPLLLSKEITGKFLPDTTFRMGFSTVVGFSKQSSAVKRVTPGLGFHGTPSHPNRAKMLGSD